MRTSTRPRRRTTPLWLTVICLTFVGSAVPTAAAHAARPSTDVSACKLPALVPDWHNEGFPTDFKLFLNPDGALQAVMLFVDFSDAQIDDADDAWDEAHEYVALHEPGLHWLSEASYGAVDVELTAVDTWYRMSQPSTAYGFVRGMTIDQHAAYIAEAVALADADVDFSAYAIVYVVAGPNAWGISFTPGYIDASDSRISADGVSISHGATFGVDVWAWSPPDRPLIMAHETAHVFSLPDVYAFSGAPHRYVGGWDVMGNPAGAAPGLFAWHRWKLGWVEDRQVSCMDVPGEYSVKLTSVDRRNGTKLAVIPTGASTAIVLESRRAAGLDADACSTGVLIYTVDSSVPTGMGPVRVIDASPGDAETATCGDLDVATLSLASRPTTFHDAAAGVTVEVVRQSRWTDTVMVSIDR